MHPALLWVGPHIVEKIRLAFNSEVEPQVAIHARLPEAKRLVAIYRGGL
jgi:hypothetical protein